MEMHVGLFSRTGRRAVNHIKWITSTRTSSSRLARPEDIEQVHRIYMDERVLPYLGYDFMDLEAFRVVFDGLLAAGGFYVVERDGKVAGFYRIMLFEGRARHVAQLGTLAVDPRFQGSGLARDMMADAIGQMKALGVRRAELQAEADNSRGLAFYRKMGFEQEGVQRRAYRRAGENTDVDEILMVRFLD
jgi:ribosomal protein S18 acetylase RimI-like enzyme